MFYCYELHPENDSAWRSDQHGKERWQARRDSNPQHAVLETAALPIGATDPKLAGRAGFEPAHLLLNRQAPYRLAIDQKMVGGGGIEPRALREPGYSRSRAQPVLCHQPNAPRHRVHRMPGERDDYSWWPIRADRCVRNTRSCRYTHLSRHGRPECLAWRETSPRSLGLYWRSRQESNLL